MDTEKNTYDDYGKESVNDIVRQLVENEENLKAKISNLENEMGLLKEAIRKDRNDEKAMRVGQIYIEAQEYADRMINGSKAKTLEIKNNLRQMLDDMSDTLQDLRYKVDAFGEEPDDTQQELIREITQETEQKPAQPAQETDQPAAAITAQQETAQPAAQTAQETIEALDDYAAQLEEFRQKLEKQQEILSNREKKAAAKDEALFRIESVAEVETIPEITDIPVPVTEKELTERDYYEQYFAEISKKYSKEQQLDSTKDFLDSYLQSELLDSKASFPEAPIEEKPLEIMTEKPVTEIIPEKTIPKKPSIKDILNKYSNMDFE